MPNAFEIENIEEMRRLEGIDDVELWGEISRLKSGDFVKLTFHCGPKSSETLLVRITSIRGTTVRGKLASSPSTAGLSCVRVGSLVAFTTAHIHSIPKRCPGEDI